MPKAHRSKSKPEWPWGNQMFDIELSNDDGKDSVSILTMSLHSHVPPSESTFHTEEHEDEPFMKVNARARRRTKLKLLGLCISLASLILLAIVVMNKKRGKHYSFMSLTSGDMKTIMLIYFFM